MLSALLVIALTQAPSLRGDSTPARPAFRMLPGGGSTASDCAGQIQGSWGEMVTFARTSAQWCAKGDGTLVSLAAGNPAVEPAGFLSEQSSTNVALRSQDFDNAVWTKVGAGSSVAPVVTANSADCGNAPDGTQTAEKVVFAAIDADPNVDATVLRQVIVYTAAAYTQSVYLKTIAGTATLYVGVSGSGNEARASITTTWQRFAQNNVTLTAAGRNFDIGLNSFEANQVADLPQLAQTVCVWFAQSEQNTHATSPIFTQGTTVTRSVTTASVAKPSAIAVNYLLRSEAFDNASWTKNANATVTADQAVAPDGTSTADLYEGTSVGANAVAQSVTTVASTVYTVSGYAKRVTGQWFQLMGYDGGGNQYRFWVDLQNGVAGTSSNGGTATLSAASLVSVGDGWYRISVSGSITTTTTFWQFAARTADANTTPADGSAYVWAAQLNPGSAAEAYVATAAATATQGEGCAHVCVTPGWTGAVPAAQARTWIAARAGAFDELLGYTSASVDQFRAFAGGNVAQVTAGFTAGVTKCYRTQWSVGQDKLQVTNLASGEIHSVAHAGFNAFDPSTNLGNRNANEPWGSARISDIRLGASWGACQ